MKYFIDTEFLEGTQRTWWGGKTKPTIDLISLALVAEDGREYYAISKDFNLKEAWNRFDLKGDGFNAKKYRKIYWIRKNVLLPIYNEFVHRDERNMIPFSYTSMKYILRMYGKSNVQIAQEVKEFCLYYYANLSNRSDLNESQKITLWGKEVPKPEWVLPPTFYGYFCDYDWVAFCWLFGRMIDLPEGFPMYCRDLKQMLDEKDNPHIVMQKEGADQQMEVIGHLGDRYRIRVSNPGSTGQRFGVVYDIRKDDVKTVVQGDWETHPDYPKQTNKHNALADAKWNMELYNFIQTL